MWNHTPHRTLNTGLRRQTSHVMVGRLLFDCHASAGFGEEELSAAHFGCGGAVVTGTGNCQAIGVNWNVNMPPEGPHMVFEYFGRAGKGWRDDARVHCIRNVGAVSTPPPAVLVGIFQGTPTPEWHTSKAHVWTVVQ
jgi:hypothetical protein